MTDKYPMFEWAPGLPILDDVLPLNDNIYTIEDVQRKISKHFVPKIINDSFLILLRLSTRTGFCNFETFEIMQIRIHRLVFNSKMHEFLFLLTFKITLIYMPLEVFRIGSHSSSKNPRLAVLGYME